MTPTVTLSLEEFVKLREAQKRVERAEQAAADAKAAVAELLGTDVKLHVDSHLTRSCLIYRVDMPRLCIDLEVPEMDLRRSRMDTAEILGKALSTNVEAILRQRANDLMEQTVLIGALRATRL